MKNSELGKIPVKTSARPRSHFNWAHDVNTTATFGDLQPLMCRFMQPNSKASCDIKSLVRLAPMVSPTFGRLKAKQWHYFVGMSDICPQFAGLMARERVNFGGNTYVPSYLPRLKLGMLSALVLIGSKLTIYKVSSAAAINYAHFTAYTVKINANGTIPTEGTTILNDLTGATGKPLSAGQTIFHHFDGLNSYYALNIDKLFSSWNISGQNSSFGNNIPLPLANDDPKTLFDTSALDPLDNAWTSVSGMADYTPVTLDGADYVVKYATDNNSYLFAFRLSCAGKRLRKILLGCGYQINFGSDVDVSLLPLFAWYKAYFDSFGLELYQNYESTNLACLVNSIARLNDSNLVYAFEMVTNNANYPLFWSFINDLLNCWVTDNQDFVSMHMSGTAISPNVNGALTGVVDTDIGNGWNSNIDASQIDSSERSNSWMKNGHAFVNGLIHGQLDANYLKVLYRQTNCNTLAGQRIAELLRMQGYGKYVDELKSHFIGFNETIINISDVVSQSDTFDAASGNGSLLGQYAGRGLEYNESKNFTFETSEAGYWVTLFAIVPESGYCQQVDGNNLAVSKYGLYNPDFDGMGMQMTRMLNICGSRDVMIGYETDLDTGFGFAPRYSDLKICPNIMNGDFNLRGTRSNYLPFTLDKLIFAGDGVVTSKPIISIPSDCVGYEFYKSFGVTDIPTAGDVWRYNAKYPWIGHFQRIFARVGEQEKLAFNMFQTYANNPSFFLYSYNDYDNFLVHNIVNMQAYSPMLPLEKSFETGEDGNDSSTNSTITKA